jgi:hypothetical protein
MLRGGMGSVTADFLEVRSPGPVCNTGPGPCTYLSCGGSTGALVVAGELGTFEVEPATARTHKRVDAASGRM